MGAIVRDLRQAVRGLSANRGVTAAAILALALGIGANTAVFSVFDAVFLRPLPHFRDPGAMYQIMGSSPARNIPIHAITYTDTLEIRRQCPAFSSVAALAGGSANLTAFAGSKEEPERLRISRVNADLFALSGTTFDLGRGFTAEDDRPGAQRVAVLGHALWQRRFAGSPSILGATILLDGNAHTVTGVLPAGFGIPGSTVDLYVPLALPGSPGLATNVSVIVVARLRDGVPPGVAQAQLDTVQARLRQDQRNPTGALRLWGLREFAIRDVRASVLLLAGAVSLVLLIACANVANLLLARGAARYREMALRLALGASRGRLVAQVLCESLVLSVAGGTLGVAAAWWGVALLPRLVPGRMPLVDEAAVDLRVLFFTLALSLATSILFGIAPALTAARGGPLREALQQGGRGGEGVHRSRLRSMLVVAEVALALILLTGAGLLIRSFAHLTAVNPGFRAEGVLTASITLPTARFAKPEQREAFFSQLLEKLEATPGVEAAGVTSVVPLSGSNNGVVIFVEGRPAPRPGDLPIAWFRSTNTGYFRALGVPLVAGRWFTAGDRRDAPPVAILNQTMAKRFWPGEEALGKRFSLEPPDRPARTWITVVGIAADQHHRGLSQPPDAEVFFSYTQGPFFPAHVAVRTSADAARFAGVLRSVVREIDREIPISQVRTLDQLVSESVATPRLSVFILAVLGGLALLLAGIGVYGVMSFSVARRTREIGIRMAMGALPGDVVREVVGGALRLALAGVLIGAAGAFALTRVMAGLLFDVSPTDPLVFAAVAALLTTVAAAASWLPARRAAALDPLHALREE